MSTTTTTTTRPVLTLARPRPEPAPIAPPVAPKLTPEQQIALDAEQRRAARVARADAIRALQFVLHDVFPGAFPRPPAAPVPLAVGIDADLICLTRGEHSANTVKIFLQRWTSATPYLEAVAAGVPRRNLDGTAAGVPTDRDREFAMQKMGAAR